jgi:hypothetical protein
VNLTANHFGTFVFRLCPKQTANELVTQECLDRYPLQLVEMPGQGDGVVDGIHFHIGSTTGLYFPSVRLPAGVSCEHCVLQWFWTVGAYIQKSRLYSFIFKKIVGFTIIISLRVSCSQ